MLKDAIKTIETSGGFLTNTHTLLIKAFEAYDKPALVEPKQERTFKPGDKIKYDEMIRTIIKSQGLTGCSFNLISSDFQITLLNWDTPNNIDHITKEEIEEAIGEFEAVDE